MDMNARMRRLERRCRLQGWALAGLVALGGLAGARRGDEVLRARQIVLEDAEGKDRIVLGATDEAAIVACYDRHGVRRATLAATEPGGGLVGVLGRGKASAALGTHGPGRPTLEITDDSGRRALNLP